MRIAYVAKHGSGGNDDEGAIAHALEQLGHEVTRIREGLPEEAYVTYRHDFCLFHKWEQWECIRRMSLHAPMFFWYFDLVDYAECPERSDRRKQWMERTIPLVRHGFCTDGDWAARYPHLLSVLRQGADERFVGLQKPGVHRRVLLCASNKGGPTRDSFIAAVRQKYGDGLQYSRAGLHGRILGRQVAAADIVLAPDAPYTERYWSNRIYLMMGMGAVLVHPFNHALPFDFIHGRDLWFYGSREDMYAKVEHVLKLPEEDRIQMRLNALKAIRERHLYLHRCEELVAKVERML